MSFVLVAPDVLETAAADLAQIGSAVSAGHLAAAIPMTEVAAAGADEVSAAIAALFGAHAQEYQAAAARAATYYEQFVRTLIAAEASYADAEATIAASVRGALGAVNATTQVFAEGPIRTIGEAWISSPLGRVLDPIINAPTEALFGRDLIGNGTGSTGTPIVIDFVRHGQSIGNATNVIDTAVPGTGLTALGQQQAVAIANALKGQGPFAGIFSSQLLRTQETAAPLASLLGMGMSVQALPGLNEINAGIFDGSPDVSPAGVLYLIAPVAWTLGLPIMPMLAPGSAHPNGVVFDQGFTAALQTMYGQALANPVVGSNGNVNEVAFSSEFAIEVGTMMNVKNPDPLLMLTHPLSNTAVVVVQGDPQDGWTLVSWDGVPVPPASLPTELFVDVRDLIMAPQFAAYNVWEALPTGDPTTIMHAIGDGVDEVATTTVGFPFVVTRDLVDAVGGSLGVLSTDL
ncbi:MAG: PE domain-containing protein [Mycobacterium sp.]|uniref:PE domain-containing protein n=1 Tax=Mycobacterium sp. TaxID=1785 RepID=UPI003F9DE598